MKTVDWAASSIKGGKRKARESALVELLVREFVEQEPDDALAGWRRRNLGLVKHGRRVEVAGLPATPHQLPEDKHSSEGEDAQDSSGNVLDSFETGDKSLPENGDRNENGKADAGDRVSEPLGDVRAGEVSNGVEKDGRQREDEAGPDNNAERTGPFGEIKQRSKQKRKRDNVDDDRNNDGGGRTNEVVDQIVLCRDERTGQVEQIQVGKPKGHRGRMSEGPHSLLSFNPR